MLPTACQAGRPRCWPIRTLPTIFRPQLARRLASSRASKRHVQAPRSPTKPHASAQLRRQAPTQPWTPTTVETSDVIFKARRIPLLASGVVALGLGIYVSLLVSSFISPPCCDGDGTVPAPDEVPTGRPRVFTKESARKFDHSLDGSEGLMGITTLRQRLAAEASGHVLEVAIGTGRNVSFYDWDQFIGSQSPATPSGLASASAVKAREKSSASIHSFTGVDISGEMLGVAVEKLSKAVPQLKGLKPKVQVPSPPDQSDWDAVSYFSDRLRLFRSDIHAFIPPPPQQVSTSTKYDTVVQTFGLCSVRDPGQVIDNLASIVKPDTGRIILVEHGRGWWGVVNSLLDKSAASHFQKYGCWWNRDIAQIIRSAAKSNPGLEVVKMERPYLTQLGTTIWVELRVRKSGES